MSSHLELRDAVLPPTINHDVVKYIFHLLDCPEFDAQVMIRKIAVLDFTDRIFAADQNGEARKIFLENEIYQKLDGLLNKSINKKDSLSLMLSTASLSLVYRLLSTPLKSEKITMPLHFLEYFLAVIYENRFDPSIKLAVSCLCLQKWKEFQTRNYFISSSGFKTLLAAAKCSTRDVMIDIIKVFGNFLIDASYNTKKYLLNVGIMKYIVEICNLYLQNKIQFGGNVDNLLRQCMICLNNFMLKFYQGKLEFYKLGGMKIISEIYFTHPDKDFCKFYVDRVLKILLYRSSNQNLPNFKLYLNRNGEPMLRKRYPPPLKLVVEHFTGFQEQTEIITLDKSVGQIKEERSYQFKNVVPFVNDSTHEIMPLNKSHPVNIEEVGKTACGMLNCQKNCTIYFGINYNNKVEGLQLNRDMKDKFRLSCNAVFNKTMQPAVSSNIDVAFIPIKDGEDVIPNLFIAELLIKPYNDFFSFKNKTYFRYYAETVLISPEALQLLVISDESKQWIRKEEKWLKRLKELKSAKTLEISNQSASSISMNVKEKVYV